MSTVSKQDEYTNCNAAHTTRNSSTCYICFNVTRYATQVNMQHISLVMDTVRRTHQDITMLYKISSSLYTSLNYQQIVLHIHFILANLRDFLYFMRQVTMHSVEYIDAVTTGILSPHVLPAEDLRKMLLHIEKNYLPPCTY